ncbi:MAG: hypothetical protein JNK90_24560 [Planctomycetaceae bacterium]|nr:hypothetical protein [Planctomycetaceae bacterium]
MLGWAFPGGVVVGWTEKRFIWGRFERIAAFLELMVGRRMLTIGVWMIVGNNRKNPPKNIPHALEHPRLPPIGLIVVLHSGY